MSSSKKRRVKNKKYQPRFTADGNPNPKFINLTEDDDDPINGQSHVVVSIVSPEDIIKQREIFFFEQFLKSWSINKPMSKFVDFIQFISYKYHVNFDKITADFQEFVKKEQDQVHSSDMSDEYKTFVDNEEEKLMADFNKKHKFQTSTRGIKIRGSYPSEEEARLRCKMIQEQEEGEYGGCKHDIFVGAVGKWLPLNIKAYQTGDTVYLEDELNQLMHEKKKNEKAAKAEFDKRRMEAKVKAMDENQKKSEKFGCKLTQTMDEHGNLVSINKMNTQEEKLKSKDVTVDDIRKELFEGEDVIMTRKTDGGFSRLPEERKVLLRKNDLYNADENGNDNGDDDDDELRDDEKENINGDDDDDDKDNY